MKDPLLWLTIFFAVVVIVAGSLGAEALFIFIVSGMTIALAIIYAILEWRKSRNRYVNKNFTTPS